MNQPPRTSRRRRASIIVVVLVMLAFAALAMTLFMERAMNDLLVDIRDNNATRMRMEGYSAMETTLAVLEDYRAALGQLKSPAEGWGDPLGFAGYEWADDIRRVGLNPELTVEVSFEDESGKISLPNVQANTLITLFKYWGFDENTSTKLTDALLGWMKPDYIPASAGAPQPEDYDTGDLPFTPPARTLRSFDELASINYIREIFFDEAGRPNEYYQRFTQTFSLYDFQSSNINAAAPDLLGALGSLDQTVDQKLADFLNGTDGRTANTGAGRGYFASKEEINQLLGADTPASQLGVSISALRIIVVVRHGLNSYRLNTLVSMPGGSGAKIPAAWSQQQQRTNAATGAQGSQTAGGAQQGAATNATAPGNTGVSRTPNAANTTRNDGTSAAPKPLNYPYTILDIRENDEVPPPPPVVTEVSENAKAP